MDSTLPVINRTYEAYKLIVNINDHLEKRWRYSLGQNIETTLLDCMNELVMAKNAPKPMKTPYLLRAGGRLEIATLQLRLLLELDLANETKIFQIQAKLAETGRMLGGWLKSLSST